MKYLRFVFPLSLLTLLRFLFICRLRGSHRIKVGHFVSDRVMDDYHYVCPDCGMCICLVLFDQASDDFYC